MKIAILLIFFLLSCSHLTKPNYPQHWWKKVHQADLAWWEISPDQAKSGEVILSKRNELGILSNFAATPFELDGKKYASVEGFWQSLKYPEDGKDIRSKIKGWPYQRQEVEQLTDHTAKKAGDFGSQAMKKLNIDWVTYQGLKMTYRTPDKGEHYKLIKRAMQAKLMQNPEVKKILKSTGDLKLKADHHTKETDPPAWKYYEIWMEFRSDL